MSLGERRGGAAPTIDLGHPSAALHGLRHVGDRVLVDVDGPRDGRVAVVFQHHLLDGGNLLGDEGGTWARRRGPGKLILFFLGNLDAVGRGLSQPEASRSGGASPCEMCPADLQGREFADIFLSPDLEGRQTQGGWTILSSDCTLVPPVDSIGFIACRSVLIDCWGCKLSPFACVIASPH